MKRISRIAAVVSGFTVALCWLPAAAQYQNEFTPAKVVKQGSTSKDIAGSGSVEVQVQVNADGSHKVIKVIKSTNSGDNDAAMEIASSSTYKTAHRGTTPITSYYDFQLRFNGKSVAASDSDGGSSPIEGLIRAGKYADAKAAAESALSSNPSDNTALTWLGVADYYGNDIAGAAQAFEKTTSIRKTFQPMAAQSLSNQAVKLSDSDPATALSFAQKAMTLDDSTNSKFALGVALVANNRTDEGIALLKSARQGVFADPKSTTKEKFGVDARLLGAYLAAGDQAPASSTADEMKRLDPGSNYPAQALGSHYLALGNKAQQAKDWPGSLSDFDQAAASGVPTVEAAAYAQAVFSIISEQKPDVSRAMSYGQKAVTAGPDDASANFAAGVAQAFQWGVSKSDADKKQSLAYLQKADSLAKSAGNTQLAAQVETFIAHNIEGATTADQTPLP